MFKSATQQLPNDSKLQSVSLKSGDLLAWKNDGTWMSHLVQAVTGGEYTHVGLCWILHNRPYVLDAYWKGGVRLRSLEELPFDHIPTNISWTNELEDEALSRLGREYHLWSAAMLGFEMAPKFDAHVCSLYAAAILRKGGLDIPKGIPLTPQRLIDILYEINKVEPYTVNELKGLEYERIDELRDGKGVLQSIWK